MMNPHAKPFYPLCTPPFVYLPDDAEDANEVLNESEGSSALKPSDILRIDLDTLTIILKMLSPTDIVNMTFSCKEMKRLIEGLPKVSAVAEFYRLKNERMYGEPTHLISALFAASYLPDVCMTNNVMAELVKGARLKESDGIFLIKEMEACSDERVTRVIGVLIGCQVPGFALCMKSGYSCYSSPLHCACSNLQPGSAEALLQIPETDVNIIVNNGIVSAPLLHWLLVKWDLSELKEDARKKRILRAILSRPDLNLRRPWKMLTGTFKAMEIVWKCALQDEKADLNAQADLLRALDT